MDERREVMRGVGREGAVVKQEEGDGKNNHMKFFLFKFYNL